METILITGATGFIGKHLVELFSRRHDLRVVCLARRESRPENIAFLRHLGAEIKYGDLRNPVDASAAAKDAHRVVHLAARMAGRNWDERAYREANVISTENLLAACLREKVKRFVHVSTVGVYGSASCADERTSLSPTNVYERTKAEAEALVRQSGLPYVIMRPSLVFGSGDRLFTRASRLVRLGIVPLIGRASAIIQPIYVKDLASLLEKTLFSPQVEGETIIAAGPDRMTLREFMVLLVPERTLQFIPLPKSICHFACRASDALERALRMDLSLDSRVYDTFTVSRTFDVSKMRRLLKAKFTPMVQALAETRAAY